LGRESSGESYLTNGPNPSYKGMALKNEELLATIARKDRNAATARALDSLVEVAFGKRVFHDIRPCSEFGKPKEFACTDRKNIHIGFETFNFLKVRALSLHEAGHCLFTRNNKLPTPPDMNHKDRRYLQNALEDGRIDNLISRLGGPVCKNFLVWLAVAELHKQFDTGATGANKVNFLGWYAALFGRVNVPNWLKAKMRKFYEDKRIPVKLLDKIESLVKVYLLAKTQSERDEAAFGFVRAVRSVYPQQSSPAPELPSPPSIERKPNEPYQPEPLEVEPNEEENPDEDGDTEADIEESLENDVREMSSETPKEESKEEGEEEGKGKGKGEDDEEGEESESKGEGKGESEGDEESEDESKGGSSAGASNDDDDDAKDEKGESGKGEGDDEDADDSDEEESEGAGAGDGEPKSGDDSSDTPNDDGGDAGAENGGGGASKEGTGSVPQEPEEPKDPEGDLMDALGEIAEAISEAVEGDVDRLRQAVKSAKPGLQGDVCGCDAVTIDSVMTSNENVLYHRLRDIEIEARKSVSGYAGRLNTTLVMNKMAKGQGKLGDTKIFNRISTDDRGGKLRVLIAVDKSGSMCRCVSKGLAKFAWELQQAIRRNNGACEIRAFDSQDYEVKNSRTSCNVPQNGGGTDLAPSAENIVRFFQQAAEKEGKLLIVLTDSGIAYIEEVAVMFNDLKRMGVVVWIGSVPFDSSDLGNAERLQELCGTTANTDVFKVVHDLVVTGAASGIRRVDNETVTVAVHDFLMTALNKFLRDFSAKVAAANR